MAIDLNESGEHEDGAVEETMVEEEVLACQFASWFPTCSGSSQGLSCANPSYRLQMCPERSRGSGT